MSEQNTTPPKDDQRFETPLCGAPSGFAAACTLPKDHGDVHSWARADVVRIHRWEGEVGGLPFRLEITVPSEFTWPARVNVASSLMQIAQTFLAQEQEVPSGK